jgi:hypothetical protein
MLRRRASGLVLGAIASVVSIALLAGVAEAQKKKSRSKLGQLLDDEGSTRPSTRVFTATPSDFPRGSLPKMPVDDGRDPLFVKASQPGHDDPAEISLRDAPNQNGLKKWRAAVRKNGTPPQNEGLSVNLTGKDAFVTNSATALPPYWYYAQYGQVTPLTLYCANTPPTYRRVVPVRSEQGSIRANSALDITVRDYLFDPYTCELNPASSTQLQAKQVVSIAGKPLIWGFRSADAELTLIFPWTSSLSVDSTVGNPELAVGMMYQLRLPLRAGTTSSVLLAFATDQTHNAWKQVVDKSLQIDDGELADVTVGIDVVQAVSDASPSITVRVTGEKEASPAGAGSAAGTATPR